MRDDSEMDNDRLRDSVSRWGLIRLCYGRLMTLVRPWFMLARINTRPLGIHGGSVEPGKFTSPRIANREELQKASEEMPVALSQEFVVAALARGDICIAAFSGTKMVSFVWRSYGRAPHVDGLWVAFEKPYRYGYKAYTRPEYRGQHAMDPTLTDRICIERGRRYALGFVESHNFSSIQRSRRLGNTCVGLAGYVKVFGRAYPFRSPGAKKHTFEFYRPMKRI